MDLKFSTTVIDSTADFDAMNFESRLCNEEIGHGEINCLMHQISDMATRISQEVRTPDDQIESMAMSLAIKLTQKERFNVNL